MLTSEAAQRAKGKAPRLRRVHHDELPFAVGEMGQCAEAKRRVGQRVDDAVAHSRHLAEGL